MSHFCKTVFSATAVMLGITFSAGASAQSTWNVYNGSSGGSGCSQNGANSGTYNNSWGCTAVTGGTAGTSMTASAWSTDRNVTGNANHLSGSGYASAYMSSQGTSGFGAASRAEGLGASSPDHAFDSFAPGTTDMMLIDFGSASVILDKIGIGWTAGDADLTVMRWTGTAAPTRTAGATSTGGNQNLTDNLYSSASPGTAGWQLVGSYDNLTGDASAPFGGTARSTGATLASSWWLISTFNTTLNGGSSSCLSAAGTASTCDASDDTFKLNYIATKVGGGGGGGSSVPEPGSLALAAVALAGIFGVRRRGKQAD